MTDETTGKQLCVSKDKRAGPYLIVPVQQLDAVKEILDKTRNSYWVDETAVSLDGKPARVVINFGSGTVADEIQDMLDKVA